MEGATEKRRDFIPLKAGIFLVAGPRLTDPNFAQSVVLLIEYGENGAIGLIINRRTEVSAADVLPETEEYKGLAQPIFFGGPVHTRRIFALIPSGRAVEGAKQVIRGVHFTGNKDVLQHALKDKDLRGKLRFFAGYAGWAPGQLESEMRRGGWIPTKAEAERVFDKDPEKLWHRLLKIPEGIQVRLPSLDAEVFLLGSVSPLAASAAAAWRSREVFLSALPQTLRRAP
ncbi:MAG: YqgE/AlgH family protein [Nitrospirae bacterium]|nr:YqgE/AlgH family protein [Nitrospirota bacterium]